MTDSGAPTDISIDSSRPVFNKSLVELTIEELPKYFNIFTKDTQHLFKRGYESSKRNDIFEAVGAMSHQKSILKDEFVNFISNTI